jgi:hypothetical protein
MHQVMNRRIFELFPLLLMYFIGATAISAQSLDQDEFRQLFDPYLGEWNGEYRIYSQQNELLNSFKVSRKYWWEGTIMMERVIYDFGDLKQTYFNRILLSEGMPYAFVTDSPDSDKIRSALRGSTLKGTTIWTRVLPKGSLPVRISERIVPKGNDLHIDFWGDQEARNNDGETMFVRIEGFLVYLAGSRDIKVTIPESEEVKPIEIPVLTEPRKPEVKEVLNPVPVEVPPVEISQPIPEPPKQKPEVKKKTPRSEVKKDTPEVEVKEEIKKPEVKKEMPPPVPLPNPAIQSAIETMNIVGIRDKKNDECIVVDYLLLYRIGDRLDMDEICFFTAIDASYLYFKDAGGYQYKLLRKDLK